MTFPEHLYIDNKNNISSFQKINIIIINIMLINIHTHTHSYTLDTPSLHLSTPPHFFYPQYFPIGVGGIKEMCILYVFFCPARGFSFFPSWGKCLIFSLKMFVSKIAFWQDNDNSFKKWHSHVAIFSINQVLPS